MTAISPNNKAGHTIIFPINFTNKISKVIVPIILIPSATNKVAAEPGLPERRRTNIRKTTTAVGTKYAIPPAKTEAIVIALTIEASNTATINTPS